MANGLPELNTQGIDITNTLAKIEAMKTNQLQRENLQSEIVNRNALLPSLIEEKQAANALSVLKNKEVANKIKDENGKDIVKGAMYQRGLSAEQQAELYPKWIAGMTEEFKASNGLAGINPMIAVPKEHFLNQDGTWNKETADDYYSNLADSIQLIRNPEEGKTAKFTVPNPKFNANIPVSSTNPITVEKLMQYKNGKYVDITGAPEQPVVAAVEKQVEAEKETARARASSERQAAAAERKAGAMEVIAASTAAKNKQATEKVKTVKGKSGTTYRLDEKGKLFSITDIDSETGLPVWREATKEQYNDYTPVVPKELTLEQEARGELLKTVVRKHKEKTEGKTDSTVKPGPQSYQEAFDKYKKVNPTVSDAKLKEYILKNHPGLL